MSMLLFMGATSSFSRPVSDDVTSSCRGPPTGFCGGTTQSCLRLIAASQVEGLAKRPLGNQRPGDRAPCVATGYGCCRDDWRSRRALHCRGERRFRLPRQSRRWHHAHGSGRFHRGTGAGGLCPAYQFDGPDAMVLSGPTSSWRTELPPQG